MMKLTNPKTGASLDSIFATEDATTALFSKLSSGDFKDPSFAQKLVGSQRLNQLSPAMEFWLHKLAQPQAAPVAVSMAGIVELFSKASCALKRPAVVLETSSGAKVRISLAGSHSKYAGSVMVSSQTFGEKYYGRITEGEFHAGRNNSPEVFNLLKDFSENPAAVASAHGHLTGSCCFCNIKLKDPRSVSVGYGKICAKRYSLPYGGHVAALAAA